MNIKAIAYFSVLLVFITCQLVVFALFNTDVNLLFWSNVLGYSLFPIAYGAYKYVLRVAELLKTVKVKNTL